MRLPVMAAPPSDLPLPTAALPTEAVPAIQPSTVSTALSTPYSAREAVLPPPPSNGVKRPRSREAILDAAEIVAAEHGAAHLTLDAVAERAGVSKGGLLYNFATKEALLEAMLDRHMHRFEGKQQQAFDSLPPGAGRALKALVLSARGSCPEREKHSGCATLAALAHNPRLLEPVRALHRRRSERLAADEAAAGLPFTRAAAISLAVDGLCLLELLQVSPYSADERQRIVDDLLRLVDETALTAAAARTHLLP